MIASLSLTGPSQLYPINTATTSASEPTIAIFTMNGSMYRNQRSYGIPAIARMPMSTYCVGIRILLKPSPNWKANTATCLFMPTTSASGAIIGMVT